MTRCAPTITARPCEERKRDLIRPLWSFFSLLLPQFLPVFFFFFGFFFSLPQPNPPAANPKACLQLTKPHSQGSSSPCSFQASSSPLLSSPLSRGAAGEFNRSARLGPVSVRKAYRRDPPAGETQDELRSTPRRATLRKASGSLLPGLPSPAFLPFPLLLLSLLQPSPSDLPLAHFLDPWLTPAVMNGASDWTVDRK